MNCAHIQMQKESLNAELAHFKRNLYYNSNTTPFVTPCYIWQKQCFYTFFSIRQIIKNKFIFTIMASIISPCIMVKEWKPLMFIDFLQKIKLPWLLLELFGHDVMQSKKGCVTTGMTMPGAHLQLFLVGF